MEILQVPHHVLGGKWHLQVLGKHLQCSSSAVKPYFHIKLFHSRSFKVRCFFRQTLIRSLLVSHQGENISFCSQENISCLSTDWLSIWNGSFLSLPCTACQDEFPCLEQHLPWNYYGKVWVSWPTPSAMDIANEALKAYKRESNRSLQPSAGPSTGRNWCTQSNIRFSGLGLHQPVPVRVPSQPDSSHQSQVTLPPCPLTPGLCSHHGLHISPHLFPHYSPIHLRVSLQLFSNPDCHTPFFLRGCLSTDNMGNSYLK